MSETYTTVKGSAAWKIEKRKNNQIAKVTLSNQDKYVIKEAIARIPEEKFRKDPVKITEILTDLLIEKFGGDSEENQDYLEEQLDSMGMSKVSEIQAKINRYLQMYSF